MQIKQSNQKQGFYVVGQLLKIIQVGQNIVDGKAIPPHQKLQLLVDIDATSPSTLVTIKDTGFLIKSDLIGKELQLKISISCYKGNFYCNLLDVAKVF